MTRDRRWSDELAAEVDHVPCPRCKADAGAPCVNQRTGITARTPCRRRILAACPKAEQHTADPEGYDAWHEWAERMIRTHRQVQCDGCGAWVVWVPKDTP